MYQEPYETGFTPLDRQYFTGVCVGDDGNPVFQLLLPGKLWKVPITFSIFGFADPTAAQWQVFQNFDSLVIPRLPEILSKVRKTCRNLFKKADVPFFEEYIQPTIVFIEPPAELTPRPVHIEFTCLAPLIETDKLAKLNPPHEYPPTLVPACSVAAHFGDSDKVTISTLELGGF